MVPMQVGAKMLLLNREKPRSLTCAMSMQFLWRPLQINHCPRPAAPLPGPTKFARGIGVAPAAILSPAGTILAYLAPGVRHHRGGAIFRVFQ